MSRHKMHSIKINLPGQILPGSISPSYLSCGKTNCTCSGKTPKLHGPYFRWTGFIDGKRKTITLRPEIVAEAQKRIKNYKRLLGILEKFKDLALQNAPWTNMENIKPP